MIVDLSPSHVAGARKVLGTADHFQVPDPSPIQEQYRNARATARAADINAAHFAYCSVLDAIATGAVERLAAHLRARMGERSYRTRNLVALVLRANFEYFRERSDKASKVSTFVLDCLEKGYSPKKLRTEMDASWKQERHASEMRSRGPDGKLKPKPKGPRRTRLQKSARTRTETTLQSAKKLIPETPVNSSEKNRKTEKSSNAKHFAITESTTGNWRPIISGFALALISRNDQMKYNVERVLTPKSAFNILMRYKKRKNRQEIIRLTKRKIKNLGR